MAGKAGSFSGVPLRTVQFWTEKGLVKPDIHNSSRTGDKRLYSALNCIEIAIVKFLTSDRMSLFDVQQFMDAFRKPWAEFEGSSFTMLECLLEENPGYIILKYDDNRIIDIYASQRLKNNPESWQSVTEPAGYDKAVIINLTRIAKRVLEKIS